jgi:hypothetical protein
MRAGSRPITAWVSAALIAAAGLIHLVLTPEHFREQTLYGVFFLAAALVQLMLAAVLLLRPTPWVFRVGALSSAGLIGAWLATRAVAPPFSSLPERVTLAGVLATGVELAALILLAALLPVGNGEAAGPPRFALPWALLAGPLFVLLYLVAVGALARVEADVSESVAVPSLSVDASNGWSLRSPWLVVALSDHVLLSTSWSVAAFVLIAGVLVALNTGLIVGLARSTRACRPQAGGVLAVAPALVAAPTCCGAGLPLGFALGGGTIAPVLAVTPWLLLATGMLLAANLAVLVRRWRAARAPWLRWETAPISGGEHP